MKKKIILSLLLFFTSILTYSQTGSITDIRVSQRPDGSGVFDVYYNLSGSQSSYNILVEVSFDGGTTFTAVPENYLSGDINDVTPGTNRHIVWVGLESNPNVYSTKALLKITASDTSGQTGQPCPDIPSFTDSRDGQTYNTVLIGNQCWTKESLKYLPLVYHNNNGSASSPRYYVYEYQGINVETAKATENYKNYGVLYNWQAAIESCPAGWRLPSDSDWLEMETYLGLTAEEANTTGWRGINLAGGLKSRRTAPDPHPRWNTPNNDATNIYGFDGYAGGERYYSQGFFDLGEVGFFWTSTGTAPNEPIPTAYARYLRTNDGKIFRGFSSQARENGYSCRCIRNLD